MGVLAVLGVALRVHLGRTHENLAPLVWEGWWRRPVRGIHDETARMSVLDRIACAEGRVGAPPGFPALPDVPFERYRSRVFFEAEIDAVFGRTWLFIGHDSEFPGPGSYRTADLPSGPVVVVRQKDGSIRAFVNACRHRGAPVVRSSSGVTRLLTCQFHSWCYDLAGELCRVPEERDFVDLEKGARNLTQIRCERWGSFIFVNFDPNASSLEEWISPIASRFSEFSAPELRLLRRSAHDIPCNWKVAVEAFLEVYHLKTVHPTTVAQLLNGRASAIQLHPHGHSTIYTPYNRAVLEASSDSMNWFGDLPKLPRIPEWLEAVNASALIFPNLVVPLESTGFPFLLFFPTSHNQTRFEIAWYAVDWGDDLPAAWPARLDGFDKVIEEDLVNLAPIQRSVECARHHGIPLNYQERRIWHFNCEVDRLLDAEHVFPALHLGDYLAGLVEP